MRRKITQFSRWSLLLLMTMLFSWAYLTSCLSLSSPSEGPCPIAELLLNISDLPGNDWFESGSRSSEGAPKRIGVERIGTSFTGYGLFDGVRHDIYRMQDIESAYLAYKDIEEEDFSLPNYVREWELPSDLSQIKLSADHQRIGCNIFKASGAEECRFLAQYGPYLVRFSIRLQELQHIDLVPIIKNLDKRMIECISSK